MGEDLAGHVLRLYKPCEKCKGTGDSAFGIPKCCVSCSGTGDIVKEIPFEQLMQLMGTVAATTASRYIATGGEPD